MAPLEKHTKLYDSDGRYVCTRIDRYHVVDPRDGKVHTMQQPAKPQQQPQAPPPKPQPERPLAARALQCKACGHGTCRCGAPTPPTLDDVLRVQRDQGLR